MIFDNCSVIIGVCRSRRSDRRRGDAPALSGRTHQGAESAVRRDRRWLAFSGQRVNPEVHSPDRECHHLSVYPPVGDAVATHVRGLSTFAYDVPAGSAGVVLATTASAM